MRALIKAFSNVVAAIVVWPLTAMCAAEARLRPSSESMFAACAQWLAVVPGLLDQATGEQRAHHPVGARGRSGDFVRVS